MGRWAEGLFQGDFDLDEACDISKDAGIELYSYEIDPEDPDNRGKGLEATREHLNRVLDGLYEKYINMNPKHLFFGKELRLVFLSKASLLLLHLCFTNSWKPLWQCASEPRSIRSIWPFSKILIPRFAFLQNIPFRCLIRASEVLVKCNSSRH